MLEQVSDIILREKKMDYLFNYKSEIGNVCNPEEDHCLRAMKIVHHNANGRFDCLISGHQNVNLSREVISILSGKYRDLRLSDHRMDKRKSFLFVSQYRNCFSRKINALVLLSKD